MNPFVRHFEPAMHDPTRDKNDKCTYDGLKRKIASTEFLLDLGLMCDTLQELSELSSDLQDCNIDLYKANKKIKYWYKFLKKDDRTLGTIINALLLLYMIYAFMEFYFTIKIQERILPLTQIHFIQN